MSKKKAPAPDFSKETIRENLTANAQRLLDAKGMNVNQLARASGVLPLKIYRVVRPGLLPQVHIIAEVADALGVTVDELIAKPKK